MTACAPHPGYPPRRSPLAYPGGAGGGAVDNRAPTEFRQSVTDVSRHRDRRFTKSVTD